jgi:hypothetical protein
MGSSDRAAHAGGRPGSRRADVTRRQPPRRTFGAVDCGPPVRLLGRDARAWVAAAPTTPAVLDSPPSAREH